VVRGKRRLGLKNFDPCTILLNNDLTAGAPGILEDLHEQYLLPPLHAGWSVRRKSRHFQSYEDVAKRFGKMLGIDPWLVNPDVQPLRRTGLLQRGGAWSACAPTSTRCSPDPQEVQGIRDQREALRRGEGRQRHLGHGHHDRAGREGPRSHPPAAEEQAAGGQDRPGDHRRDHPGRACSRPSGSTTRSPSRWCT
jgi:hypothetical protein